MDRSKGAAQTYDRIARSYLRAFQDPSEHIDEFLRMVPAGGRILDVGCGPGVDANHMQERGCAVTGVDLSEEMVRVARETCPAVRFEVGDMRRLSLEPGSFDGIVVAHSLIHVPKEEVAAVLRDLYATLKRGGAIYVAVQAGKSQEIVVPEPLDPSLEMFLDIFTPEELVRDLERAGFSVARTHERAAKDEAEFGFRKFFVLCRKQG